ncbi:hypothetical protein CBER1_04548 [Cercospora berteroae]|uniref:Uncharacterized protein n=1 Tax=Cercospora berteroae TaxID=357750 RepID=A0A2S6C206_9PEZI|nr:hypothetical protein CBER1_04548 [Cercospora berteroae]
MRQPSPMMVWKKTLLLLSLARRGLTSSRVKDSEQDSDSWSYSDDESASNRTSSGTSYINADDPMPEDLCPFLVNSTTYDYDRFLTKAATDCGSVACCRFKPLTHNIMTWKKMDIAPVTVGVEVFIIDQEQDMTLTATEIITTAIVATFLGGVTTLDPSLWIKDGTFDGGYDVPTTSTTTTDRYNSTYTVKYPSVFVDLEIDMEWYGSLPIVSAGVTTCLQNDLTRSPVPSPTYVSTPEMTVDPTEPKGIFYTLVGNNGIPDQQVPAADWGFGFDNRRIGNTCGGDLAKELYNSWQPTEPLISIYSTCTCELVQAAPGGLVATVSVLLDRTTRFDRLTPTATESAQAGQKISDTAATETSSPELETKTDTSPTSISVNTVGRPTTEMNEQRPSRSSDSVSTTEDAGPLQAFGPQSETRTAEPLVASGPALSVSPNKPSTPVQNADDASRSASISNAASSRIEHSIQKSVEPSSSSAEGSSGPTRTAQDTVRPQSDSANSLQSATVGTASRSGTSIPLSSPVPGGSRDSALSSQRTTPPQGVQTESINVNSQLEDSANFRIASSYEQSGQPPPSSPGASTDPGLSSQRTTQSPSHLAKPVTASSQSAATSSDAPPAAVVVANGQLSMVSVEPSSQSGALSLSSIERDWNNLPRISPYRILADYTYRSGYRNIEPDRYYISSISHFEVLADKIFDDRDFPLKSDCFTFPGVQ